MKFVQEKEAIRWFRGHLFLKGKPTFVEDRCTQDLLAKDSAFQRVDEAIEPKITPADGCRKCGRIVKQGRYMHEKFCTG